MIEYVTRNGHSMEDPDTRDYVDSYAKDPEGFEWLKADAEKPKESAVKLLYVLHPVDTPCRDIRIDRSRKTPIPSEPSEPLIVSIEPPQATLNGVTYPLSLKAAVLLKALQDAQDWVSATNVVNQPARVVQNIPDPIRRLIESIPGAGTRLKPHK